MEKFCIAIVIGSLRKESLNRKLGEQIIKLAPANVDFELVSIGDLPLYDQDQDENQAESVKRMKAQIHKVDGVIFVTPEYNRSIPGVLKNALDHGSRPYGQNAWARKPAGIIGISPSPVGTAIAQQHLRVVLATLDMPTLGQPEMFLQMKDGFFDESGNVNELSRKFIKGWIDRFLNWVSINKGV
jgi:chromate reductase